MPPPPLLLLSLLPCSLLLVLEAFLLLLEVLDEVLEAGPGGCVLVTFLLWLLPVAAAEE